MVNHDKGSDHTDDALVAGDHNWAEDPTILWGQKRPDSFFDGQAILIVGQPRAPRILTIMRMTTAACPRDSLPILRLMASLRAGGPAGCRESRTAGFRAESA
jgi:hypothetical protein